MLYDFPLINLAFLMQGQIKLMKVLTRIESCQSQIKHIIVFKEGTVFARPDK